MGHLHHFCIFVYPIFIFGSRQKQLSSLLLMQFSCQSSQLLEETVWKIISRVFSLSDV